MIKNEEHKGFWFLPDNIENKVPGILYFDKNKEIRLELIGGFETNVNGVLKNILNNKTVEIIHGVTNKNEKISLLICNGQSNLNFPSDFQTTNYFCQYFIKGKHLSDVHEHTFNRIQADLSCLYDWCPLGTIRNTIEFSEDKKVSKIMVSLNKKDYWKKIVSLDSEYKLMIFGDGNFIESYDNSEYNFSQNTVLEIAQNKTQKSFADLLNKVGLFKQFLSFATLSPVSYIQLTLFDNSDFHEYENGEKTINPITLYFTENKEIIKPNKSHLFLFNYKDIEVEFPSIIKKWYQTKGNLAPIRNHLIASVKPKKVFTSLDFLIIVQSLEGYHRRFIKKKIIVPKRQSELELRLNEIIKLFSSVDKIKNNAINLTHVVKSRNYYSHFYYKDENVLDGNKLYYLTRQLRSLLICCVLNLIGFDIALINKLLNKNERL